MRTVIRVGVSCLLVVVACSSAPAREIDKDFHETFDVSEGVVLRLDYDDGDVTITPWDQDVIDVVVRYHADVTAIGFGSDPDFDVEFRQTDDRVTVRGIEGSSSGVYFFRSMREYEYTYVIKAPSYVRLDLTGDDGDLELSGWRADIECRVDDGDVKFTDVINRSTEIWIEDGDIRLAELSGDLVVRGDDGDVAITNSTLTHALFALEDGDIRISDSEGNFDATVDDGDVTLSRVTTSVVDVRSEDGSVNPDHAAAGFPTTCDDCHGYADPNWQAATYPHSVWPLVGSHTAKTCGSCHTADVFAGLPSGCVDCHLAEPEDIEISIKQDDYREDIFHASGPGGQHVNKTASAIRLTHFESGIVVSCQDEKSQHKNRAKAMSLLAARLKQSAVESRQREQADTRRSLVGSGDRSERIRTYNFPQGRLTDHRINLTLYKLGEVMAGELDEVLDPLVHEHQAEQLAALQQEV